MTTIFRRSNLPVWLTGGSHPPKAPTDAQVRDWVRQARLPDAAVEPLARVMEKALVRRAGTLDFSAADPNVLHTLPASLLVRLSAYTRRLLLPQDCPPQIAHRLIRELRNVVEISPPQKWEARKWEAPKRERRAAPRPKTPPPPRPASAASIRSALAPAPAPSPDEVIYEVPRRRYDGDYELPQARGRGSA